MADHHPRYVCLHFDGTGHISDTGKNGPAVSYVLDRWYCHREVAKFTAATIGHYYLTAEQRAERRAAQWNAEHDAWLAQEASSS